MTPGLGIGLRGFGFRLFRGGLFNFRFRFNLGLDLRFDFGFSGFPGLCLLAGFGFRL